MSWILKPDGLVEPVPAPEFFVDGIGAIEECDGLLRVFYYANRTSLYSDECAKQVEVILRRPVTSVKGSLRLALSLWLDKQTGFVKKPYLVR